MFTVYVREILSPMLAEKLKYFEYFLNWYHLMKAKASASRISTMKTPPKKARANEELELVAEHGDGFGVIVVVGGVVVGLDGALVVVVELVVIVGGGCGGVDVASLGELEVVASTAEAVEFVVGVNVAVVFAFVASNVPGTLTVVVVVVVVVVSAADAEAKKKKARSTL